MILASKKQFIPLYLNNTKPHSIRGGNRWRAGMDIQYYANSRTKNMRKFMPDRKCLSVQSIKIESEKAGVSSYACNVFIDGRLISVLELLVLSINDGFTEPKDFIAFFHKKGEHKSIFEGQIIHWTDLKY